MTAKLAHRLDMLLAGAVATRRRHIGLAVLRVIIGVAGIEYYLSDIADRYLLWGPNSYISPGDARQPLTHGLFSVYLWGHSTIWFNAMFFLGLAVACTFTVCGGRALTIAHAVMLWSLYNRNQDLLEGGDNLVRIIILFMILTSTNLWLSPGAGRRRARVLAAPMTTRAQLGNLAHNIGAFLVVFQIVVLYAVAGYFKLTATMWNDGVAMYYVSRIHQFQMFGIYPHVMANPYIGWVVSTCTIVFEVAVPFVVLSRRSWLRKVVTLGLESMHVGIIVFMGLVAFGLIMIGADFALLQDEDYRSLGRAASRLRQRLPGRVPRRATHVPVSPVSAPIAAQPLDAVEPL